MQNHCESMEELQRHYVRVNLVCVESATPRQEEMKEVSGVIEQPEIMKATLQVQKAITVCTGRPTGSIRVSL